jgi:ABC-type sugar transport system substrate-binding protein
MRKSFLLLVSIVLMLTLAVGTVAAGGAQAAGGSAKPVGNTVYVFGPTPDHGWTGSAARFAESKITDMNRSSTGFNYVFKSAAGPDAQIAQIEQVLTESQLPAGVVIQCSDDAVLPAVEQLARAGIPLVLFDRLVDNRSPIVREAMIAAMASDNLDVGAGIAYYFVEKGMMPGDGVWEMPGDNSSVTRERSDGFRQFLLGTRPFTDDQNVPHTIAADKKWTQAQIDTIVTSQVANWSRDNAKSIFEAYIAGKTPATVAKWFYTMDDEFAMGILEFLQTPAQTAARTLVEQNVKGISGSGGLIALYETMTRSQATAGNQLYKPEGVALMSASVRPAFFINAIQLMADYLAGKDITVHYTDPAKKRYMERTHLVDAESYIAHKDDPAWQGFD